MAILKGKHISDPDPKPTEKVIDYSKAVGKKNWTRFFSIFLENSFVNFFLNSWNSFLTLFSAIYFIYSSYNEEGVKGYFWGVINFLIRVYFLTEFLIRTFASKNKKQYLLSEDGLLEIVTIIPFFIIRFSTSEFLHENSNVKLHMFSNLFSLLRLQRLEKLLVVLESEINRQLFSIVLGLITLIVFFAGVFQLLEKVEPGPSLVDPDTYTKYHFFLYFVMTTISTIGYNNDFEKVPQKVVLTFLIVVTILVNSTKISKLIHLLSSKSMYARARYKLSNDTPHIVLTGSISNIAAADFFIEFFHEDHGDQSRHIVILLPYRPDSNMENLLRMPQFQSRVIYIQGDPINDNDLKRCHAESAKAIVIMCNKHTADSQEEDARTILQAMMLKKYLKLHRAQSVRICMQILRPEGKTHYYLSLNRQVKSDQVICVEELKLSLMAKSCLCPGLITFVSNLITSSGEPPKKSELDSEWLEEYWKGKQFEIYKTVLSSKFAGKSFSWVAAHIYKHFNAILFAIELEIGSETKILINPGDFLLPEHRKVVGYIITEDKAVADEISNYQVEAEPYFRKRMASTTTIYQATLAMPSMGALLEDEEEEESEGEDFEDEAFSNPSRMKFNYMNNFMSGELTGIEEKCHISPSKIYLSDVTYFTMEDNILATNHIILAGIVPNLINFVMPLRAKYLPRYPPIVILNPFEPSYKYWNQVSFFPEIYFVKGSALIVKDLIRANIKNASMVVILASASAKAKQTAEFLKENNFDTDKIGEDDENDEADEDSLDAKTIFKYKEVKKILRNIPILTELVSPQNVAYLLPDPYDYTLMRKFGYTQVEFD